MSAQTLAIFAGLPGCGKTTLAQPFAQARGWTYVSRDEIRGTRFKDWPAEVWKQPANQATEDAVRQALAHGESVVVDGMTFATPALRERFAQAAREQGACFMVVWVDCPVEEAIRRVALSSAGHPAGAERNAARVREVAARFGTPTGPQVLRLDALQPLVRLRAQLEAGLPATPP